MWSHAHTPYYLQQQKQLYFRHICKYNSWIWKNNLAELSLIFIDYFIMFLTNFMELSPSWEATSCAVTQELSPKNIDPKGSLQCSQESSTCLYLGPDQSYPYYPLPLSFSRPVLILSTHVYLGLLNGLFPSAFSSLSYMHSSPPQFLLRVLTSLRSRKLRLTTVGDLPRWPHNTPLWIKVGTKFCQQVAFAQPV
jgi:hypothetical protein